MLAAVFLLLLGPSETIAGKYVQHSLEYLERCPARVAPLPAPLPSDVDSPCRLVESGPPDDPDLFAWGAAFATAGGGAVLAFDKRRA